MKTFVSSELLASYGAVNAVSLRISDMPMLYSMRRTGRIGGPEESNRKKFFKDIGFEESAAARVGQIHSDHFVFVEKSGNYPNADALVTTRKGLPLAISIADCVLVLLFDRRNLMIAAVHAGWRGTSSSIAGKTLDFMIGSGGCRPEDLLAYIGPSAGQCCYEVGEEVAANFDSSFLKPGNAAGKSMLDLKSANAVQLTARGIPSGNIDVNQSCTICNLEFHSFRREGNASGRMIAAIGIR